MYANLISYKQRNINNSYFACGKKKKKKIDRRACVTRCTIILMKNYRYCDNRNGGRRIKMKKKKNIEKSKYPDESVRRYIRFNIFINRL